MSAALKLAASLILSLLMWLPTVPSALTAHEDPARLGGRYLLALLIARVGVGLVFRIVGAYVPPEAEPEPEDEADETVAQAPVDDDPGAFGRRREDQAGGSSDQELFDEALDEVDQTAALIP